MDRYKLHRKGAPETSVAAAYAVDVTARERLVLDSIKNSVNGLTIKELARIHPDVPYTTLSARPKGLQEKGLIYYSGDIREKSRVMRAVRQEIQLKLV